MVYKIPFPVRKLHSNWNYLLLNGFTKIKQMKEEIMNQTVTATRSYKRRIVLVHTGKKTRAMSKRKNDMLRVNESATRFKVIESSESTVKRSALPSPYSFPPFLLFRSSASFPSRWFHPFTLISLEVMHASSKLPRLQDRVKTVRSRLSVHGVNNGNCVVSRILF